MKKALTFIVFLSLSFLACEKEDLQSIGDLEAAKEVDAMVDGKTLKSIGKEVRIADSNARFTDDLGEERKFKIEFIEGTRFGVSPTATYHGEGYMLYIAPFEVQGEKFVWVSASLDSAQIMNTTTFEF